MVEECANYINWGLCISALAFGFLAGWNFGRFRYARSLLGALLFIFYKLERRNVWLSSMDRDVITQAVNFVHDTRWINR